MSRGEQLEASYPELFNVRSDFGMWCNDCRNFPEILDSKSENISKGAGVTSAILSQAISRFLLSWSGAFDALETSAGLIANNARNFEIDLRKADDGLAELYPIR
ncbi:MAG: hypothetical protein ACRC0L_04800 [Angustibacter sp.]